LLLSFGVPLQKLAGADLATMVTVRGVMPFTALFAFWFAKIEPISPAAIIGCIQQLIAVLRHAKKIRERRIGYRLGSG